MANRDVDLQAIFSGTREMSENLRLDEAKVRAYLEGALPGFRGPLGLIEEHP